jgi:hypothetical protein
MDTQFRGPGNPTGTEVEIRMAGEAAQLASF